MTDTSKIHLLLIEDDEDDYILTCDILSEIDQLDAVLNWAKSYQEGLKALEDKAYDIAFIDYRLGESDGINLIEDALERGVQTSFVLLTGKGSMTIDMEAMNVGATDYLVKSSLTPELMERCIRYTLKHKAALKRVKEEEDKFRRLFERSIDAIFTSDLNHKLLDTNPSFQQLLKCESITKYTLGEYFEHQREFDEFQRLLIEQGQVKDFEATLLACDDEIVVAQLSAVIWKDPLGTVVGYQGIIRDISLQKEAERQLLVAEKLSMTGKIARSIAHEVRNPLTNLGLALDQLEDELPKDNEDMQMFVGIIERNARRIGQLITEMLNSSKPKELNKRHEDINELMTQTLSLISDRITLKGMKLEQHLDPTPLKVLVDADKFKIAILNILVNAIEAMNENSGVLTVVTRVKDDNVVVEITDNGVGIAEEDVSKLFDPFQTKKQGGMGLGLTSTQNIIHSHGGRIDVLSQLKQGTTFTLTLPNKKATSFI